MVVCLSVSEYFCLRVRAQDSFHGPLGPDEPNVAQVEVTFLANWARELVQLLLQLENAVAAIDNEKLVKGLTLSILAVAKPIEAVFDLPVPWPGHIPVDLFNVAEQVKPKVEADRYLRALSFSVMKL